MGACISSEGGSVDSAQALVVDVEKVISQNAWRVFRGIYSTGCGPSFLKRQDYTVEVPKNYYHFKKTGQEMNIRNQGGGDTSDVTSGPEGKLPHGDKTKGLQNYFRNSTGERQIYQFHFQKTRRSEARVSYQKGFCFGGATDFSVNLPKILPGGELGAEIDMHMEVTKTEEQSFAEESTTSMTSDISVSPHSCYVASVILEDTHFTADYKVFVTMELPARVFVANIRNKEGEIIFRYTEDDLTLLFPKEHHVKDRRGNIRGDVLQFVVEGVINGTQMSNQRIQLLSQPLS